MYTVQNHLMEVHMWLMNTLPNNLCNQLIHLNKWTMALHRIAVLRKGG